MCTRCGIRIVNGLGLDVGCDGMEPDGIYQDRMYETG